MGKSDIIDTTMNHAHERHRSKTPPADPSPMGSLTNVLIIFSVLFVAGSFISCWYVGEVRDGPELIHFLFFFFSVIFLVLSCILRVLVNIRDNAAQQPADPPAKPQTRSPETKKAAGQLNDRRL